MSKPIKEMTIKELAKLVVVNILGLILWSLAMIAVVGYAITKQQ